MTMHPGKTFMGLCTLLAAILLIAGHVCAQQQQNGMIDLKQAYRTALEKNEQVRISGETLQQAKKDIGVAESNLYPQISADAAYTRKKEIDFGVGAGGGAGGMDLSGFGSPDEYGTLSLGLKQHIYQWGKVWSGKQIAEYYFQSTRYRHIRQVQQILYRVSVRYYEVLLGRRSIEIAETALKRARQQLERAEAQFEVGVLTKTDVLRARVQLAQSREQLERAKNDYDIALEQLALEMGIDEVPGELAEPAERAFKSANVSKLFSRALSHRRDFNQAKKQLRVASERVKFERADYFPNLSLNGQYTLTDEEDLFYGESYDWQAQLVLSYPLFTGWRTTSELGKAKSQKSEAEYALNRLKKEIRNEVRSVYLDIQTQKKVIAQLEQQVESARQNYQQVSAQFEEGLLTAVDQVDAFTALVESENRLAQAYYSFQMDLIRLDLAVGTFQSDLLQKELLNEKPS